MLYVLLVLLLVTRLFGELAVRAGQPVLVGELLSGITLGVLTQQFSGTVPVLADLPENEIFDFVTNLAMFFLMLLAGTEMRPRDLAGSSGAAVAVAVGGLALPMALGFALGWAVIPDSPLKLAQSLFLATALAITAVPVTVKVLLDLGRLQTKLGQTIVAAAVFDAILSLLLLAVLTAVIETGGFPQARTVLVILGEVAAFFAITLIVGRYAFPWAGPLVKGARAYEFGFSALLIGALALALLAEALGMHFIIGAFAGGLFFMRQTIDDKVYEAVQARLSGITSGFLAPVVLRLDWHAPGIGRSNHHSGVLGRAHLDRLLWQTCRIGASGLLARFFAEGSGRSGCWDECARCRRAHHSRHRASRRSVPATDTGSGSCRA